MNKNTIINRTVKYVRDQLSGAEGGHDRWHILRVWKLSINIVQAENVDIFVIEDIITQVESIVANISFKGGKQKNQFRSAELDVVQDADSLDAMGAIGMVRYRFDVKHKFVIN